VDRELADGIRLIEAGLVRAEGSDLPAGKLEHLDIVAGQPVEHPERVAGSGSEIVPADVSRYCQGLFGEGDPLGDRAGIDVLALAERLASAIEPGACASDEQEPRALRLVVGVGQAFIDEGFGLQRIRVRAKGARIPGHEPGQPPA
jgi:hypothetical protein